MFAHYRRRERAKTFPVFNLEVEIALHGRRPWIAQDRAGAERAWSELHATLKPTTRLLACEASAVDSNIASSSATEKRAPAR